MKHYNLMPVEGDWCNNAELIGRCGSLFPFITTEKKAISYARLVKKQFPNVKFELTEGETFGSQILVKEF